MVESKKFLKGTTKNVDKYRFFSCKIITYIEITTNNRKNEC